jgi:hypothetical protein
VLPPAAMGEALYRPGLLRHAPVLVQARARVQGEAVTLPVLRATWPREDAVTVVIPCRPDDKPTEAIESLMAGTFPSLEFVVVVDDQGRGQSWARNRGLDLAQTRYVLFSDYDIRWRPEAVEQMWTALRRQQLEEDEGKPADPWRTGYAYSSFVWLHHPMRGEYRKVPLLELGEEWDWATLKTRNFISTMALVDKQAMLRAGLRFDESLRRLEDWDLWLQFGSAGYRGEWTGGVLFETDVKPGISFGNDTWTHAQAEVVVRTKHVLA